MYGIASANTNNNQYEEKEGEHLKNKTKQRRTRDTHKDEKWRETKMAQSELQHEMKGNENRRPHYCFVKKM
jgi:hypothetical protein